MSSETQPTPRRDDRPLKVVVVSHTPFFYWWPSGPVGFLMAAVTYWHGDPIAFVPPGTVAERGVQVEGHDGTRDVLIAPGGQAPAGRVRYRRRTATPAADGGEQQPGHHLDVDPVSVCRHHPRPPPGGCGRFS